VSVRERGKNRKRGKKEREKKQTEEEEGEEKLTFLFFRKARPLGLDRGQIQAAEKKGGRALSDDSLTPSLQGVGKKGEGRKKKG